MKLFFGLLLAGITCSFVSAQCSNEELEKKCRTAPFKSTGFFMTSEEEVERYCDVYRKQMDCHYQFYKQCGGANSIMTEMDNLYNQLFAILCKKQDPFMQKYVKNAVCLNKAWKHIRDYFIKNIGNDQGHCRSLESHLRYSDKIVEEKCGKDALDVFQAFYHTMYKYLEEKPFLLRNLILTLFT